MSHCNGNNHHPWCNCAFSGGNKELSSDYYAGLPCQYIWVKWCESFTAPNAICPVCNVKVFFYSNEQGSKVYFDSLGWPWPIHPCFDKDKTKSKLNKKINPSKSVGRASSKFVKIISNSKKESGVIIIDVQYGRKAMRFYCKCFESIDYLMSIKNKIRMEALTKGRMRFLCGVSVSKNIIGYPSIKDLLASSIKTTKSTNTDWKKWDGKLKLDYGTSMASAMELVLSKRK
jgi:hypothetical protein